MLYFGIITRRLGNREEQGVISADSKEDLLKYFNKYYSYWHLEYIIRGEYIFD